MIIIRVYAVHSASKEMNNCSANFGPINVLKAFPASRKNILDIKKFYNNILIDSGAFGFRRRHYQVIDGVKGAKEPSVSELSLFAQKYANFLGGIKNTYDAAFELDILELVNVDYDLLLKFRKALYKKAGDKLIHVYHRATDEYENVYDLIDNYKRVSASFALFDDINMEDLNEVLEYSISCNTRFHLLGLTSKKKLLGNLSTDVLNNDLISADSSSWLSCMIYGRFTPFSGESVKLSRDFMSNNKQEVADMMYKNELVKQEFYLNVEDKDLLDSNPFKRGV
jgi:hypothetical protein